MTEELRKEVRRAADVQPLPTECAESEDVLDSLKNKLSPGLYAQLEARVMLGVKKYGSRLKTLNGRDVLLDAKQEAHDGIMYAQQAYLEGKDDGRLRDRFIRVVLVIEELQNERKRLAPSDRGNKGDA